MADASIDARRRVSFRDYFCLPVLIILTIHLPYFPLLGVTRAIHFLIYPMFLCAFFVSWGGRLLRRPVWNRQVATVVVIFIALACCYFVDATMQWQRPQAPLHLQQALSCCDFFCLNIATYFCLTFFCRRNGAFQYQKTFHCCVNVIWGCLIFNTVLVLFQNTTGSSTLLNFWVTNRNDLTGLSVSSFGVTTGRLSGIYFLPLRAGIQYSLGLFLLIDRYKKQNRLTVYEYCVLAFLLVGSILASSKTVILAYIVGGVYLFYRSRISLKLIWTSVLICVVLIGENILFLANLASFSSERRSWYDNLIVQRADSTDGILDRITAGRFNSGGTVYQDMKDCFLHYPLTGKGLGNNEYSIDSGYNFALFAGGVPLLLIYVGLLAYLFLSAFFRRKEHNPNVDLLFFLAAYIILADLGAPTLMQHHFGPAFASVFYLTWGTIASSRRSKNSLESISTGPLDDDIEDDDIEDDDIEDDDIEDDDIEDDDIEDDDIEDDEKLATVAKTLEAWR